MLDGRDLNHLLELPLVVITYDRSIFLIYGYIRDQMKDTPEKNQPDINI